MIIFELILTTIKPSTVFRGSWGSSVNWLEPEIKPPTGNFACPNLCNSLLQALSGPLVNSEQNLKNANVGYNLISPKYFT